MSEVDDRKLLSKLMDKYSLEEISSIFSGIDDKIIQLHKCSSNDFLELNEHFKGYYKESKIISDNANLIFEALNDESITTSLKNVADFGKNFTEKNKDFDERTNNAFYIANEIQAILNEINLPLNNFWQNMMSLKFLIANIKLNTTYAGKEKETGLHKSIRIIEKITGKLKNELDKIELILSEIKSEHEVLINTIKNLRNKKISEIGLIQYYLLPSIALVNKKKKESLEKLPALKEKTDFSSKSLANIITNLQYQDIIRQKIEHIQKTHEEIIKDLSTMVDDDKNEVNIHTKVKIFLKIRDIAGLQAAQLLHANKEYQTAIETITEKFRLIGETMARVSQICLDISLTGNKPGKNFFETIQENLYQANETANDYIEIYRKSAESNTFISHKTASLSHFFSGLSTLYEELKEETHKLILAAGLETEENNNLKGQISAVLKDSDNYLYKISASIKTLAESRTRINNAMGFDDEKYDLTKNLHLFNRKIENVIDALQETNLKIDQLLNENSEKSTFITRDIENSIENVKYYDLFEKVIEKIIHELNSINLKLNTDNEELNRNMASNLEYLKQRYTMASEHHIHDKMATFGLEGAMAGVSNHDPAEVDEEDDNLELF
ncbi:MAG: hypothetical protein ACOCYF_00715 [Bacteroidota bacterium]